MIRSTVIVEGYELDLLEDISTDFTYSIQDIREPDKRTTDFSKTIEIPGTPKNNSLFAHIFDLNVENEYNPAATNIGYNFNPNKVAKALVLVDGIQVFKGVIRILKITIEKGLIKYETNVFGRLSDILFAMGDKKLSDIDFSDLDHQLLATHINDVWHNPNSYKYAYPLIDYGLSTDGINYPIQGFAPAIYVKEYIDRMFTQAGFSYVCPFFSQPYFRSLIIPTTEKDTFSQSISNAGKFLTMSNRVFSQSNDRTGNNWREITFEFTKALVDPYGLHTGSNLHIVFTRPLDTSIQFDLKFRYKNSKGKAAELFVVLGSEGRIVVESIESSESFQTKTLEIPRRKWNVGDTLLISLNMPTKGFVQSNEDTCHWYMPSPTDESEYPIDEGATVTMANFVSKSVTQKDLFKSLILMHNLYVFTDPDNDTNLYIVPQTQFYSTFAGDAVDWTYKVDYSKEIEVIPMGELTAREFLFTYKEDSDYYNADLYKKKYNEVYGQKKFTVDNDFEKDTNKIELIFSPTPGVQSLDNNRIIPHIYKVDKDGVKQRDAFNIRILQYGGLVDSLNNAGQSGYYVPWNIIDGANTVILTSNRYPYAGMFNNPVNATRDLCFGPPLQTFFQVSPGYPDVGLFKYYWQRFINEVSNKDSKLWKAYVLLTPNDINQLDFKRLVKIDNIYFKLNKVDGYNPLTNDVTRVELFKTIVQVEVVRPGFILHEDGGYLLHSDGSSRIPYA